MYRYHVRDVAAVILASMMLAALSSPETQEPPSLDARLGMVRSLIAAGNSSRAEIEISILLKSAPDVAAVHAVSGMHQARVNNPKAARIAYERALELSPGLLEALSGLTYLDLGAAWPISTSPICSPC